MQKMVKVMCSQPRITDMLQMETIILTNGGFSIIRPDDTVTDTLLYVPVDRFSVSVDSYHFGNLINYQNWKPRQNVLDIAKRYMNP